MALAYYAGRLITGTNSDRTGGTWTNLAAGYRFFETDTSQMYYWNGSAWVNAVKTPCVFQSARTVGVPTTTVYGSPNAPTTGGSDWSGVETDTSCVLNYNFDVKLVTITIRSNSFNGTTTVTFRDDAADVSGSAATVLSTDTTAGTIKTSSAISATIAAGSRVGWKVTTASTSGSQILFFIVEGYLYK